MWLLLGLFALSSVEARGLDGCADVDEIRAEIAARLPPEVPVEVVRVDVALAGASLTVTTRVHEGAPRVRTLSFTDADCPVAARLVAQVVARQVEELAAERLAEQEATAAPREDDGHEEPARPVHEDNEEHEPLQESEARGPARAGGPTLEPAMHLGGSLSMRAVDPIATGGGRLGADMSLVHEDWLLSPCLGLVVDAAWPVPVGRGGGQLSTAALTLGLSASRGAWSATAWLAAGGALAAGVSFTTPRAAVLPWAAAGAVVGVDVASTVVGQLSLEVGVDVPLTQVALAEQGSSSRVPGPLLRAFGGVALHFRDLPSGM